MYIAGKLGGDTFQCIHFHKPLVQTNYNVDVRTDDTQSCTFKPVTFQTWGQGANKNKVHGGGGPTDPYGVRTHDFGIMSPEPYRWATRVF